MSRKLKLALIGCGAATEYLHIPALRGLEVFDLDVLVDPNLDRARLLQQMSGAARIESDYRAVLGAVDAALVVLPNYLHAPVAMDLLASGISVLVEKPMALTSADCDRMLAAAESTGARLAVGHTMRFFDASRIAKQAMAGGWLGRIESFDLRHGVQLTWPVKSDYLFRREKVGGGVLADSGVHQLDLLLWWLGEPEAVDYYDDAFGGVEANCELHLRMASGAVGTVELSRIRRLRNTCIIRGERGTLEVALGSSYAPVRLSLGGEEIQLARPETPANPDDRGIPRALRRQLEEFAAAIQQRRDPLVSGYEARRAVRLMEECYARAQRLEDPWLFTQQAGALRMERTR